MACVHDSKQGNETHQETMKGTEIMRLEAVACLQNRQNNEDHSDVGDGRQQQKLGVVNNMLPVKKEKALPAKYII